MEIKLQAMEENPVGSIVAWAGTVATIPSEYQLCDGFEAQTPALAAITGTYVPDLRSRFIVGAHDVTGEGTWPSVGVGSTGGSANSVVVLTLTGHMELSLVMSLLEAETLLLTGITDYATDPTLP